MPEVKDYLLGETAWCPGCGNFGIRSALAGALSELELEPHEVLICSGIGQAAKIPHYIKANGFNGLHGRAVSPAIGARVANKNLTVIVESGDGDTYGEGGNHFIHNIRRNPDIAHFVHNNQIYGLTKGQASPTSDQGMKTGVQVSGVILPALNPLSLALVLGAGFVARCYSAEKEHLKETMKAAISFPGYALVDILQPCVSFNKINTYGWYKERIFFPEIEDPEDWAKAMELSRQWGDKIPLGIFYKKARPSFESLLSVQEDEPLAYMPFDPMDVAKVQDEFL
jgi:2-oxoglutarate/2-oxoacid ferredoxin oxidoreductase subunit beta